MSIEVVADPRNWTHWEQAKTYLEPAARQGGFTEVLEPDEELFAVLDGELLAVATAWFAPVERFVEVKLIGGRDHRRWLTALDQYIGQRAKEAGATSMRGWGRAGWVKSLRAQGWEAFDQGDGSKGYVRWLGD